MFSWVTNQLETLSNAVAPPPTDPAGKFLHCCIQGDESSAIEAASHLSGAGQIVQAVKNQVPIHVACHYNMVRLLEYLMTWPGVCVDAVDAAGNTPLHVLCISPSCTLASVQLLVNNYSASVVLKNYAGETPYDVATLNSVRQFLLPIQLQRETQEALDNGGVGLPPGIDLGGLKIRNVNLAPPPTMMTNNSNITNTMMTGATTTSTSNGPPPMTMMGPPPTSMTTMTPSASVFDTPTVAHKVAPVPPTANAVAPPPLSSPNAGLPAAPSSGDSNSGNYATRGYSSAHIYNPKNKRIMKPDGFHSSSSDKRLQEKYGHQPVGLHAPVILPPPPSSSGNTAASDHATASASNSGAVSAPPSFNSGAGVNPFAGGYSALVGGGARAGLQRYVQVDPRTGMSMGTAASASPTVVASPPMPAFPLPQSSPAANVSMFIPRQQPSSQHEPVSSPVSVERHGMTPSPAPGSGNLTSSPAGTGMFLPPPPRRVDGLSSASATPSSSDAPASFPSPPRPVTASFPAPPMATSSPFASAPSPAMTTTTTSSPFASPPSSAAASTATSTFSFPAPPSSTPRMVSDVSTGSSSSYPSASDAAANTFASPPSGGLSSDAAANTFASPSSGGLSATSVFATPQPVLSNALRSLPQEQSAAAGVFSSSKGSVLPSDPLSGNNMLPSSTSAIDLFGKPPVSDAVASAEAASLPAFPLRAPVQRTMSSDGSGKSAAELFGLPTPPPAVSASSLEPLTEPVEGEANEEKDENHQASEAQPDALVDPAVYPIDVAADANIEEIQEAEQSGVATEVEPERIATPSPEATEKVASDFAEGASIIAPALESSTGSEEETDMLQEVPLSPTGEQ